MVMGPRHSGARPVVGWAARQRRGGRAEGQHNGDKGVAVLHGGRERRHGRGRRARCSGVATVVGRGGCSWSGVGITKPMAPFGTFFGNFKI